MENFKDFEETYIKKYETVWYLHNKHRGYIVWRLGTGQNVELLHIRAIEVHKGHGEYLMRMMTLQLKFNRPYHSVFVFTKKSNTDALNAYKHWGFQFTEIPNLYRDDGTMLGTISFTDLCNSMGV